MTHRSQIALVACLMALPVCAAEPLTLQETMRQGREFLVRNEPASAVEVLEKRLGRVAGDPAFLALLRESYQAYLKELQLANKIETYEIYRKRLAVLEKPIATLTAPAKAAPKPDVVRAAAPDEDPFQQTPLADKSDRGELLARAEQSFADQKFTQAKDLFTKASQSGPALTTEQQKQYAYCLLHSVVDRLNSDAVAPADLDREARAALAIVPKDGELAKFGQQVLQEIGKRKGASTTARAAVKHGEAANGWKLAESANFKLYHTQDKDMAEQLLQMAEQYRSAAFTKWSTASPASWQPGCEIFLYATGEAYAKATKQPATSPGHSTIKLQGGKVGSRRMDLRGDDPNLLGCVLPHEITHVALGDLFADTTLPRWADEGMAVLAEPRSQVDRYLKTMVRLRLDGKLIPLAQILGRPEYPDAATITVFYVESVSIVEFLVNQKGPAEFAAFAREAAAGIDSALSKHYGIQNVADLQDRWLRATFTDLDKQMGIASR